MANIKAARSANRRRDRNVPLRSRVRTLVTKARKLIAADELDSATQAVDDAVVALDKAAQKGAIHRNNAARRKSRIMRRLSQARGQ